MNVSLNLIIENENSPSIEILMYRNNKNNPTVYFVASKTFFINQMPQIANWSNQHFDTSHSLHYEIPT